MNYDEEKDKRVPELEIITENIAALITMVQTQNDVLLVLANKLNIDKDIPKWNSQEELEKEVGPKIQACIESIRSIYGPGKADKN